MKKYFRIIGINIGILFSLIIFTELLFGSWIKGSKHTNVIFVPKNIDRHYPINDKYPSNKYFIHYKRDEYGLRGNYGTPENINILTIGGSTTDEQNVSEGETWSDVLQKNFKNVGKDIYVANAGIKGQTTFGHIKNFDFWFNQIPALKPDYFLFYIGLNDFYWKNEGKFDKNKYGEKKGIELIKNIISDKSIFADGYFILKTLFNARQNDLNHAKYYMYHDFSYDGWVSKPNILDYDDTKINESIKLYKERIDTLHKKVKNYNAKAIFVSQSKRGRYDFLDGKLIGRPDAGKYDGLDINGIDYYYLQNKINLATKQVAEKNGDIFIDLCSDLEFNLRTDFYDTQHTTPIGSKKIGDFIFSKIKHLFM